jgi:hypothetical protein
MSDKKQFERLFNGQMILMQKSISNAVLAFRAGKCHGMVMLAEILGLISQNEVTDMLLEINNKEMATRSQWS